MQKSSIYRKKKALNRLLKKLKNYHSDLGLFFYEITKNQKFFYNLLKYEEKIDFYEKFQKIKKNNLIKNENKPTPTLTKNNHIIGANHFFRWSLSNKSPKTTNVLLKDFNNNITSCNLDSFSNKMYFFTQELEDFFNNYKNKNFSYSLEYISELDYLDMYSKKGLIFQFSYIENIKNLNYKYSYVLHPSIIYPIIDNEEKINSMPPDKVKHYLAYMMSRQTFLNSFKNKSAMEVFNTICSFILKQIKEPNFLENNSFTHSLNYFFLRLLQISFQLKYKKTALLSDSFKQHFDKEYKQYENILLSEFDIKNNIASIYNFFNYLLLITDKNKDPSLNEPSFDFNNSFIYKLLISYFLCDMANNFLEKSQSQEREYLVLNFTKSDLLYFKNNQLPNLINFNKKNYKILSEVLPTKENPLLYHILKNPDSKKISEIYMIAYSPNTLIISAESCVCNKILHSYNNNNRNLIFDLYLSLYNNSLSNDLQIIGIT